MSEITFQTLQEARAYLADSAHFKDASSKNSWSVGRTLLHCAQSIDCSIDGFPEQKGKLFQATLGALAFNLFKGKGKMNHGLESGIPGIEDPADSTENWLALDKLIAAIDRFIGHEGELKPHFAYGPLSKEDFDLAHAMHIANHLNNFELAP